MTDAWAQVRTRLQAEVSPDTFDSFLAKLELVSIENGIARHSQPAKFLRKWTEDHYAAKLLACWQAEDSSVTRVEIVLRGAERVVHRATPALPADKTEPHAEVAAIVAPAKGQTPHEVLGGAPLDRRFTFERFAVAQSNAMAHAAIMRVAQAAAGKHPTAIRSSSTATPASAKPT